MINHIKQMFNVFDRKQKINLIQLMFLMIINAFFELIGVSAILPFIDLIVDEQDMQQKWYIGMIVKYLKINNSSQLFIFMALLIILIYIIKNVFSLYVTSKQLQFTYQGKSKLSNEFMNYYMHQDYSFHLNQNSAELIKTISNDTDMFYATVLNSIQLVSELCICVTLVLYLLFTDIWITCGVTFALGIMLLFFTGKYKKELIELGNKRRYFYSKMMQHMQQAFGGIKEIKVANKEKYFFEEFETVCNKSAHVMQKNLFLNALPKPIMEIFCISGLMLMVCVEILLGANKKYFISILAVFAVSAFRLMPSVNKIAGYVGNVMHNGVVVNDVYTKKILMKKTYTERKNNSKDKWEFKKQIDICKVYFKYGENLNYIIEGADFTIKKNSSIAIIGASGAGKTTLVDLILGVLVPSKGSILVDQKNINDNLYLWRNKIGYIPQNIYMLDNTIRNNIAFGVRQEEIDDDRVWKALEEAQLKEFVMRLPDGLDMLIGESGVRLSGGQRQRIGIARALYNRPEVLILDEATSALDNDTEGAVMESIEHLQGKLTMIIIAHRLSTIKNCDEVYEVGNGKVSKVEIW